MIRVDSAWLATEPLDMRAGMDTALARVIAVFGAAEPHHAYVFAKYADHLPLNRQESIFARAGLAIPRSTLAQWVGVCGVQQQPLVDALKNEMLQRSVLHADETPVPMLKPGEGSTHRAYLWAYAAGAFEDMKAVVYNFCESRAGSTLETSSVDGEVVWCATTSAAT